MDDIVQLTNADEATDFNQYLAKRGFDGSTLSSALTIELEATWRDELRQVEAIANKYGDANPAQAAATRQAVYQAWQSGGLRDAELAGLRGCRPSSPGIYRQADPVQTQSVLEAGMLASFGVDDKFIAKEYGPQVADRVTGKNYRSLTLHGLARHSLAQQGRNPGVGMLRERDLRDAIGGGYDFHAGPGGPSTYSIPNVLSNVANKMSIKAFDDVGVTWRTFCRASSVNDFKTRTDLRIIGSDLLAAVPKGGEIKQGQIEEQALTNSANTVGQLIGVDRRDIINDDLSILSTLPTLMGRNAAVTIEKAVYTALIGNAGSFFSSGNSNYSSGSPASVLSDTGLTNAMQKFGQLTGPDGEPTFLRPSVLLVPPALWRTGRSLTVSTGVTGMSPVAGGVPDGNIWAGMFQLVEAPYLAASAGLSGVDTSWYLLVSPGDFSCVDVCFLNGKQTPTIETFDFDVNQLGMTTRVYHDFGVALYEKRGGVLSVGA